jgi:Flp pilus assembly protein TadB
MNTERMQADLDYVASAVRRSRPVGGPPLIYFMWAVIIAVGWALPAFAPRFAAPFWLACGIGGGLASWWLASRDALHQGVRDAALGRRWGGHWLVAGAAYLVCWLPALRGAPPEIAVGNFLLVTGLVYALAGVHLERPLLWSGLLMLAAYVVLVLLALPYTWTASGLMIALALAWAGLASQRQRAAAAT